MKKFLAALAMLSATSAFAANYVSVDVDRVNGVGHGAKDSVAQYVRAGTELGGIQWGLQSRTARTETNNQLFNSMEITGAKSIGFLSPFVGVGRDNGLNGANPYNYGLVGATTGFKVGPGFTLLGAKTRVGTTEDGPRTKQTVAFATYSIPVSKTVSLNINASKSYQTIKENSVGLGLGFKF